uniref:Choline kinase 2 n=1 Tax=Aegilops tauschii subsp. strangulata TaxID=200361 RepID=A0A453F7P1_AEGTS
MVAIENQSQAQRPAEPARIPKEARRLLHDLAAAWPNVADCRALEVVPLKGAMTNEVYQVRWLTAPAGGEAGAGAGALKEREVRKVLVRIYGDGVDLFFDREDELRTFECMSRHGQGPRLLGRFPNGRVEEFIHARVRAQHNASQQNNHSIKSFLPFSFSCGLKAISELVSSVFFFFGELLS